MTINTCPACGSGSLSRRSAQEKIDYKGLAIAADDFFHACDNCGTEVALDSDIRDGLRARTRVRKHIDGLLSAADIRDFRRRFAMTQELAASLFGGGKVAFSKYENDDITQSDSMDALIRVCRANPGNIAFLAQEKGISLPKEALDSIGQFLNEKLREIVLREVTASMSALKTESTLPSANDSTFRRFKTRSPSLEGVAA